LLLENWLVALSVYKLNLLLLVHLLHSFLDLSFLESCLKLFLSVFALSPGHELTQALLYNIQNSADLSLGQLFVINGASFLLTFLVFLRWNFMLHNILAHNHIVKFQRIFVSKIVVKLSTLRLDNVRFLRASCIVNFIIFIRTNISLENTFMVPCRIFLLYQSFSWTSVLFHFWWIEFSHYPQELILFNSSCILPGA
jgi:hypothetical protein